MLSMPLDITTVWLYLNHNLIGIQVSENVNNLRRFEMRDHYDFSDSVPNPYAKKLKKQITIRLDEDVIEYFNQVLIRTVFLIRT
jgi:hypothetical protein